MRDAAAASATSAATAATTATEKDATIEALRRQLAEATEPLLANNNEVYSFAFEGDVKKLDEALKAGGTPDGHKVSE